MKLSSPSNRKVRPSEIKITQKYSTRADQNPPPAPVHRAVPNNYLCPVDLDFTWMTTVLRYAAYNITHMKWNKGTTESYCKSCAIPDKAINKMYAQFNQMNLSLDKKGVMVQSNNYITFIWLSIVPMCAWIDAGMRHSFHRIVHRIMLTLEDVFTYEVKNSTFEELVNPYLTEIQNLRLHWVHKKTLPKMLWLSKDELGFSRIACFIY